MHARNRPKAIKDTMAYATLRVGDKAKIVDNGRLSKETYTVQAVVPDNGSVRYRLNGYVRDVYREKLRKVATGSLPGGKCKTA